MWLNGSYLPGVYLLKSLIVLMPVLLIIQGLAIVIEKIFVITGSASEEKADG